ncbi:MAG TPA: insulinase family protein, partial [Chitinophagaceae bacterium]
LAQVLGQGRTSVLFQQLTKKQLALQASASSGLSELAGEFHFVIIPNQGKSLADIEKLYYAALDSFEKRGVTDDDLEKFKAGFESQTINSLQSVQGKATQLAQFQFLTGNPNQIAELLKLYNSLTKEDVMRVYNQYIKNKGAIILSMVPKGQEALIAHTDNFVKDTTQYVRPNYGYEGLKYVKSKDNFDRSKIPGNGPNPVVKVPKIWRKDLANGARVIGTENTEVPTVTLTITIPGGHLLQANDLSKVGVSNFFANMMNEDTKNNTAEQLAVKLQMLGSSVSINGGTDGITFNVQALKKNLDATLAILQERMFSPKFTEAAFKRIKNQKLQSFKSQKGQPGAVADAVFAKLNFGPNHILALNEEGTEASIEAMTLSDIENYYNNNMTSMDAKVVIVGDIKENEILPKLAFLDKLPKKKIVLPKVDPAPVVDKTQVFMVDVPKSAQSEFRVGYATGLKYDATGDYYKSNLANYALGGNFNSRLNLNLREDKGWTYGASSGFSGDEYAGTFEFNSGIRSDATDSALIEVMKEMKNFVSNGPTDDDVLFMKSALAQSEARRYETGPQKATFIGRILDYNLPANYTEQQNKILQKITKDELHKIAQQQIKPEKMNILLVGDKQSILEKVKKLGYEVIELDSDGKKIDKRAF